MNAIWLASLLALAPARAEDAPKAQTSVVRDVRAWFEHLREGLRESAVRAQHRRMRGMSAVAAVRGDVQKSEDPDKPYWKGTEASKEERQTRRERAELNKAVDLALAGKGEEAKKAFDAFEAAHPKSELLPDCKEARARLADLAPAAAATTASQTEVKSGADPAKDGPKPVPAAEAGKP